MVTTKASSNVKAKTKESKQSSKKIEELVPDMVAMLEAGVHFGHERSKRNPKMEQYIVMQRNRIAIIDLEQTIEKLKVAVRFIFDVAKVPTREILFVGTKWQARPIIQKYAEAAGQPYVTKRWLGGTLTNFSTILKSIEKLEELKRTGDSAQVAKLTKKEKAVRQKEIERLGEVLEGIKGLKKLPAALYVAGSYDERIAVREARRVGIPIIGIVDTNADPDLVDYPMLGNDDAIRSLDLFTSVVAKAILLARGKSVEVRKKKKENGK